MQTYDIREAEYIILVKWGAGIQHIAGMYTTYDSALTSMRNYVHSHNKKHKRGNVPTVYILKFECFMKCEVKLNKVKKISTKRIPKGVITMRD